MLKCLSCSYPKEPKVELTLNIGRTLFFLFLLTPRNQPILISFAFFFCLLFVFLFCFLFLYLIDAFGRNDYLKFCFLFFFSFFWTLTQWWSLSLLSFFLSGRDLHWWPLVGRGARNHFEISPNCAIFEARGFFLLFSKAYFDYTSFTFRPFVVHYLLNVGNRPPREYLFEYLERKLKVFFANKTYKATRHWFLVFFACFPLFFC